MNGFSLFLTFWITAFSSCVLAERSHTLSRDEGKFIVVADDTPVDRDMTTQALVSAGYPSDLIYTFESGEAAMDFVIERGPERIAAFITDSDSYFGGDNVLLSRFKALIAGSHQGAQYAKIPLVFQSQLIPERLGSSVIPETPDTYKRVEKDHLDRGYSAVLPKALTVKQQAKEIRTAFRGWGILPPGKVVAVSAGESEKKRQLEVFNQQGITPDRVVFVPNGETAIETVKRLGPENVDLLVTDPLMGMGAGFEIPMHQHLNANRGLGFVPLSVNEGVVTSVGEHCDFSRLASLEKRR